MLRTILYYLLPCSVIVWLARIYCERESTYRGRVVIRPFYRKGLLVEEPTND